MNRSLKIAFRQLIIGLGACMFSLGISAQKKSKTFSEKFTVSNDAVLEVNTSYADIEFETWNKDVVEVVALIELEGATEEEAKEYFDQMPIEIMGNSQRVTISSKSKQRSLFPGRHSDFNFDDLNVIIPDVSSLVMDMRDIAPFPELTALPPVPMTKAFKFDYEAYRKDGEAYMKKWQKNFEKSFDKEHQERLEEWSAKIEQRAKQMQQRMEQREEAKVERLEKRVEELAELAGKRGRIRVKRFVNRDSLRVTADSIRTFFFRTDSLRTSPNTFYFLSEGENKNYKIKKTIKVKLPKATRIKMDVRHGEVKLAESAMNLNATLSHSSLWASTIDGNETDISVSYSPVRVQKWQHGQLKANYSKEVALVEVVNLQLSATSSDVTIDELLGKTFIKSDFGPLIIKSVGNSFQELDVSLKNAELQLRLPTSPTAMYIKGTNSELSTPNVLLLTETKNGNTIIHKGNHLGKGGGAIHITSEYSDIVIR